jgi:hypothetical protein
MISGQPPEEALSGSNNDEKDSIGPLPLGKAQKTYPRLPRNQLTL